MSELKNFIEENSMSKFELDEEGKDFVGFRQLVSQHSYSCSVWH